MSLVTEHQPDLIITDLKMPVMTGLEFVKTVRANNSKVKILVYASFISHRPEDLLAVGADLCLHKPADLDQIKQAIDKLLMP